MAGEVGEKSCRHKPRTEIAKLLRYAADRVAVVPVIVVGWVHVTGIEVQLVRVVAIVDRTRPIVTVVAGIVERTVVDVAGPS